LLHLDKYTEYTKREEKEKKRKFRKQTNNLKEKTEKTQISEQPFVRVEPVSCINVVFEFPNVDCRFCV